MSSFKEFIADELSRPPETRWEFEGGCWKLHDGAFMLYLYREYDAGVGDDGEPYEAGTREDEMYYIDLDDCRTCAGLLDSIFQVHNKTWVTAGNMHALLRAIQYVIHPQGVLVSFGHDLGELQGEMKSFGESFRQLIGGKEAGGEQAS